MINWEWSNPDQPWGRKVQNLGPRRAGCRLGEIPALKGSMGSGEFKYQDRSLGRGIPLGHRIYGGGR